MLPLLLLLFSGLASSSLGVPNAHDYYKPRSAWHHEDGHPVEALFKRDDTTAFPAVGSSEWASKYPSPDTNWPPKSLPKQWTDALAAATQAGKIPNLPVPTIGSAGSPVYPNNNAGISDVNAVCSATYQCEAPGDIWNAPDGHVALAFDDGPLPPSPRLYQFLKQNHQHATHFFIGGNVLANPQIFLQAFQDNQDDIAVHTYTHPYMTIQSNEAVLAELGWTMQIIYDSTGGRVPKFWRPPYGDTDNRVRAIAKEVFGLTTVIWNQDSEDWELTNGAIPQATVQASLQSFYNMPKSPGLAILEHELSEGSVSAFISSWDVMHQKGWIPITIPDAANQTTGLNAQTPNAWYQNSLNDTAPIASVSGVGLGAANPTAVPGSGSSSPASAPASGSPSGSGTASASATGRPSGSQSASSSRTTSPSGSSSPAASPSHTNGALSALARPSTVHVALFVLAGFLLAA